MRADTSITATVNQAKRYINIGLIDMHLGFMEKFPWAERSAILLTQAPYETGSVTISQGSTSLTGASTAWNTNNAFGVANVRTTGAFRIAGGFERYAISSVDSDTGVTLADTFVASDQSAASYVYFEDEYSLASDFLRPIDQHRFSSGHATIDLMGRTDFRRRFGQNYITGRPRHATILDRAPSGSVTPIRRIRLHPVPDAVYQIPYDYVTSNLVVSSSGTAQTSFSADADEPIVPLRYRMAIVLHGAYNWYRDKKNDTRAQEARAEYDGLVSRITGDNEIGSQKARIQPRVSPYRYRARQPWSGGRRNRYDVNGEFDRMEDL